MDLDTLGSDRFAFLGTHFQHSPRSILDDLSAPNSYGDLRAGDCRQRGMGSDAKESQGPIPFRGPGWGEDAIIRLKKKSDRIGY